MEDGAVAVQPRDQTKDARSKVGALARHDREHRDGRVDGFPAQARHQRRGLPRGRVQGKVLKLALGYSHDIDFEIPSDIQIVTPKPTEVHISGIDKQRVGQVAAVIRGYRGPEPYKGKGVKYSDETIFRKEGKKK